MKIAAIGDIHVQLENAGTYRDVFRQVSQEAEVLILAGDLTDRGSVEEAELLSRELEACTIPVIAVLGNHDWTDGNQAEIRKVIAKDQIHVLEGESVVIDGVGFAGVKGFGGGYGVNMQASFGEPAMRNFVTETVQEALKLDSALAMLDTDYEIKHKVVVTHYSPIRDTVVGEPEEVIPFMGSTHLAEAIDRRNVAVAFHGHAHRGTLEGKTMGGVPVFNVCKFILQKVNQAKPWFLWELKT